MDLQPAVVGRDEQPAPRVPLRPLDVVEVPCEVAGTQLVADVRAPTVELPDHGDDRGMERDDAEGPRTHPAMVIVRAGGMLPNPS